MLVSQTLISYAAHKPCTCVYIIFAVSSCTRDENIMIMHNNNVGGHSTLAVCHCVLWCFASANIRHHDQHYTLAYLIINP